MDTGVTKVTANLPREMNITIFCFLLFTHLHHSSSSSLTLFLFLTHPLPHSPSPSSSLTLSLFLTHPLLLPLLTHPLLLPLLTHPLPPPHSPSPSSSLTLSLFLTHPLLLPLLTHPLLLPLLTHPLLLPLLTHPLPPPHSPSPSSSLTLSFYPSSLTLSFYPSSLTLSLFLTHPLPLPCLRLFLVRESSYARLTSSFSLSTLTCFPFCLKKLLSHTFSRLLHTLKRSTASGWNTLNTEFSLNPVFSSCVCVYVHACMHVVQACVHKTHLHEKSGLVGISFIPRLFVGNGQSKRLRCCTKLSTGHISCAGVTGPADVCDSRRPLSNSSPPISQACYCLTFSIILMSHFCSIALVFLSSS